MNKPVTARLGFLINSRPELLSRLGVRPGSYHILCESYTVITPKLEYEIWFEGWKRSWVAKVKADFVAMVLHHCSEEFPDLAAELRDDGNRELFDKWWTISRLSVMEIDGEWRPS
jgi:hypothetical protein